MCSLRFIELQQMSNKLEKLFFFSKLPNLLFVQCTQMRGSVGRGRDCKHSSYCNVTPDTSPGVSSLEVRTN